MVVKAYNEAREHGGINGLTPSKMFLQRSIKSDIYTKKKGQDSDDKRPPNSHIRHYPHHDLYIYWSHQCSFVGVSLSK